MKAALFHEFGGPEVLRIEEVTTPQPGPGEVLVRVRAAGMNHLDVWVRTGLPIETPMPHIGGSDVAGIVEATGPGVSGVRPGARVVVNPSLSCGECEWCRAGEEPLCVKYKILGEHTQGGFAEFVVVPAANLFPLPEDFSFEQAAAVPLVFLTAWRGLVTRGRLKRGESVLITGASGGVATAALQIAKHIGARVFAVTSTANIERVKSLGADVVYDRTKQDFAKQIWVDTSKRGVDLVFDSVGHDTWHQSLRALSRGGRIVVYGATTGAGVEFDLRMLFWKQLEIIGTTMSNRSEFEEVMRLVFAGELRPVVDRVFRLDEIRAAHDRLEKGEQFGNIVVVP